MTPARPLDDVLAVEGTVRRLLGAGLAVGLAVGLPTTVSWPGEPWPSLTEQAMVYLLHVPRMAARPLRPDAIVGRVAIARHGSLPEGVEFVLSHGRNVGLV